MYVYVLTQFDIKNTSQKKSPVIIGVYKTLDFALKQVLEDYNQFIKQKLSNNHILLKNTDEMRILWRSTKDSIFVMDCIGYKLDKLKIIDK